MKPLTICFLHFEQPPDENSRLLFYGEMTVENRPTALLKNAIKRHNFVHTLVFFSRE
jgi:hypothetical protein